MDLIKIGSFIKDCRKAKSLTQEQLAERLGLSPKTISKWECAKGLPDASIMLELCEILSISVNELLNGCHIDSKDYMERAEEKLLEMQKLKQESDKRLLNAEILIGTFSTIVFLACIFVFCYMMEVGNYPWGIFCLIFGFVLFIPGVAFCLYIEQKAGFYECQKCNHKFVPSYSQVLWAPHIGRSRKMKCPHCSEKSYCKKVVE